MKTTGRDLSINLKGSTISYDDLGNGEVPIIFIHGFPFNKSSWQPQMEFLKNNHRVIAYDIRGFGKSTANGEVESINLFADDLIRFMNSLEITKAVACGLSMGGYILLNAVNRYPEKFQAIILSDTQCIADSEGAKEKRYKTIEQIEYEGLNDFADGFVKNIFCKETLNNKNELVQKIRNIILSTSPVTISKTLSALAQRSEMCSTLNEIMVPALILYGKEDIITPSPQAEFLHNNITNSTIHCIENAGHMSNLEQSDVFNQHLSHFISGWVK